MHSADHQHMGEPRAPVGRAEGRRKMGTVPGDHGRQHPGRPGGHPLPQGSAEPLLQPGCPGTEGAAPAQRHGVLHRFRRQHHAVGVEVLLSGHRRGFQRKTAPEPVACFADRQTGALHPEGHRFPGRLLHPQHGADGIGRPGGRHLFHFRFQQEGPAVIGCCQPFQPGAGVRRQAESQRCPQDQTDAVAPGRFPAQTPGRRKEQPGSKKCRKRHKKSHLRQKSAHQLQPQCSDAENTERPAHLI